MRVWLSGPRLFGGLVRPGVSFGPEDVRAAQRTPAADAPQPLAKTVTVALYGAGAAIALLGAVVAMFLVAVASVLVHG